MTSDKKRIAILMSGPVRYVELVTRRLDALLAGLDHDFFYHLWQDDTTKKRRVGFGFRVVRRGDGIIWIRDAGGGHDPLHPLDDFGMLRGDVPRRGMLGCDEAIRASEEDHQQKG